MTEDECGIGIFTYYAGPFIKDGGTIATHRPLGTVEETASLAELVQPYRLRLPDGVIVYAAFMVTSASEEEE